MGRRVCTCQLHLVAIKKCFGSTLCSKDFGKDGRSSIENGKINDKSSNVDWYKPYYSYTVLYYTIPCHLRSCAVLNFIFLCSAILWHGKLHCHTSLYNITPNNTTLYSLSYSTISYSILYYTILQAHMLCYILLVYAMLYYTISNYTTILHQVKLCHTLLYNITQYNTPLYYTILCYVIPYHTQPNPTLSYLL